MNRSMSHNFKPDAFRYRRLGPLIRKLLEFCKAQEENEKLYDTQLKFPSVTRFRRECITKKISELFHNTYRGMDEFANITKEKVIFGNTVGYYNDMKMSNSDYVKMMKRVALDQMELWNKKKAQITVLELLDTISEYENIFPIEGISISVDQRVSIEMPIVAMQVSCISYVKRFTESKSLVLRPQMHIILAPFYYSVDSLVQPVVEYIYKHLFIMNGQITNIATAVVEKQSEKSSKQTVHYVTENGSTFMSDHFEQYHIQFDLVTCSIIKFQLTTLSSLMVADLLFDSRRIRLPLLKDKIAIEKLLLSNCELDENARIINSNVKIRQTYLMETISEIIQYPPMKHIDFEYKLVINSTCPRQLRMLKYLNLLKLSDHKSKIELVATKDTDLKSTIVFIKELSNPDNKGLVITLYKLTNKNPLIKLVIEYNKQDEIINSCNKSLWWYMGELSMLAYNAALIVYSSVYRKKIVAGKIYRGLSKIFNDSQLSFQRTDFDKDFIKALSFF